MPVRVGLTAAMLVLAALLPSGAVARASSTRLGHGARGPAHARNAAGRRCSHRATRTYGTERRAFDTTAAAPLAATDCNLFAAPYGSDASGNGTSKSPFASLTKLDRALEPGQTGCLQAGTYGSTSTWHQIDTNGTPAGRVTIAAYPGESVTVVGYVDIEAGYTTLEGLNIDGSNIFYKQERAGTSCPYPVSQPLVIAGPGDILQYDNYYQSVPSLRGNGIGIGFWGDTDDTIIRYDKIHDVGQCQAYDHLIYLSHGNHVQIYDNWMWNDPHGRGVQLYPAPTNARVYNNVIARAGEGFAIGNEPGDTVSGNQIYHNIVMDSTGLSWESIPGQAIHDYYGGTPGSGNSFYDNLSDGNPGGLGRLSAVTAYGNMVGPPRFVDPAAHDFQVEASSPAAGWGLWNGD